jgi:hypothetical protein
MTTLTDFGLPQRVTHDPSKNNSYQDEKQGSQVWDETFDDGRTKYQIR